MENLLYNRLYRVNSVLQYTEHVLIILPVGAATGSFYYKLNRLTSVTTTILWPFVRDYPDEPVPEG